MIRHAIFSVCIAACVANAAGQRVANFSAALELAKSNKAVIGVLVRGSDWNRPGELAAKIWNDPRFLAGVGSGVILLDYDRKENPTEADQALAKLNEKCNPEVRSIPAIILYDSEGRWVGSYSGTAEIEASGGLLTATKKLLVTCRERDDFWKSANGASAMMKAGRLGQGLDRMGIGLGPKGVYQPILEEMQKADPQDQSGYIGKYTFSAEKLVDLAIEKAEKKEFAEAERELMRWNANPRLSPKQRQELHAARFALYQRWPEKKPQLNSVLESMRDIDPKSDLGRAAANYLQMLSAQNKKDRSRG
jgi:hypothetical protein